MRILFVNQSCGYLGGVEQYIADNGRGLAERGHEVFLAYGSLTEKTAMSSRASFPAAIAAASLTKSPVPAHCR